MGWRDAFNLIAGYLLGMLTVIVIFKFGVWMGMMIG